MRDHAHAGAVVCRKSMGKGTFIPMPFFVDVFVGWPLGWTGGKESFMARLRDAFANLKRRSWGA